MTFGDKSALLDANAQFVRFSTWVQVNQQIFVTDFASAPPGNNCSSSTVGTYDLLWNNDCTQVVLQFRSDSCKTRFPLYDNVSMFESQSCANNIIGAASLAVPWMELVCSLILIALMMISMSH